MRTERRRRLVYSVMGLGLVLLWGLPWETLLPGTGFGLLEQDPQWTLLSFVVKGPALILGGILVIMFSADSLLQAVSRVLGGIGALTPVLKTAIAYPLSSRFRTGMAMVMFAMIITTVVLMSVVIQATESAITPDAKSSAGFDISTSFGLLSFFDRVTDLEGELAQMEDFPQEDVAAVGAIVNPTVDVRQAGPGPAGRWHSLELTGMDEGFMAQAREIYTFQQRAAGIRERRRGLAGADGAGRRGHRHPIPGGQSRRQLRQLRRAVAATTSTATIGELAERGQPATGRNGGRTG